MESSPLATLPNELLLMVTHHVGDASFSALTRTSRRFQPLEADLYRQNARQGNSSALQWGAEHACIGIVRKALAYGADPNSSNSSLSVPDQHQFYSSSWTNHWLWAPPPPLNLPGEPHYPTPLCSAAATGRLDIASLLIKAGAAVAVTSPEGDRAIPVVIAIEHGHLDMIKFLISSGNININSITRAADQNGLLNIAINSRYVGDDVSGSQVCHYLLETLDEASLSHDRHTPPLMSAIRNKKAALFTFLYNSGRMDPNQPNHLGETPLMWAIRFGPEDESGTILDLLLRDDRVDFNAANHRGLTAFAEAARFGHEAVVRRLLEMPTVDPNQADLLGTLPIKHALHAPHMQVFRLLMASDRVHVDGYELFHLACDRSYPAVVEELLQRDDIDKTTTGIDGSSWLHEAASNGCTDAASELIFKHRSDINKQRSDGATPLICALRRTHGKVVTMLLEAGADVNMALVDGRTPLYFAASHFKDDLLEQLLRHGSNVGAITSRGESALHEACRHAFPTVVRRLLLHGADPVRRNKRGETPLELACMGHPKTVKVLLDNGADLLQRNSTGASYLYQACQRRFAEVVAVLLDRGADPNAVELGSTPFLAACWAGSVEIVHVLLSHGADVRAATHIYGITGLHAVCYPTTGVESSSDSLYRLARTMIREGADVNARMLNNITPLHVACKYFRAGAIKALGNAGADPLAVHVNPVTTRGITPIHLLSRHLFAAEALRFLVCRAPGDRLEDVFGSTWSPLHEAATSVSSASVSMLLEHGANPMALTEDGRTALHLLFARFETNPFPDWAEGINQALEVVAALTKCDGFDINHRDNGGATALGLAGDTCPARVQEFLVKQGAVV